MSIYVVVDQLLPLVGVAAVLALSAYLGLVVRGAGVPLALYGLATTVMVTLNGNLVAVHRYLLPVVGVYVAVALLVDRGGVARAVAWGGLYVSVLAQAVLYALFAANIWVG